MPINYKKYPKNWKWLSKQIIERARGMCELCHLKNGIYITRDYTGRPTMVPKENYDRLIEMNCNKKLLPTKVCLTVHHINFNINDNHALNLIALCQRCHLRLDIREKLRKRKEKTHAVTDDICQEKIKS